MNEILKLKKNSNYILNCPTDIITPIILTSPHSGYKFYDGYKSIIETPIDFNKSIEDKYVDELFSLDSNYSFFTLKALISRSVIDLNRKIYEINSNLLEDPGLHKLKTTNNVLNGIGLIPVNTSRGKIIYNRKFSYDEIVDLISNLYSPWHDELKKTIKKVRKRHENVLLVDLHSMPSSCSEADIVIGDNYGNSCDSSISEYIIKTLKDFGFKVYLNNPFSGGYISRNYRNFNENINTIQIEIKRSLYMDEVTLLKKKDFELIQEKMSFFIKCIEEFIHDYYYGLKDAAE